MKKNSILYKLGYFYYHSRVFVLIFTLIIFCSSSYKIEDIYDSNLIFYTIVFILLYNLPYIIIMRIWERTVDNRLKWFCHDICHEHIYAITESVDTIIVDGRSEHYHKCLFCNAKDIW